MKKVGWKARAKAAEAHVEQLEGALSECRFPSMPTFDTLTICFSDHTVTRKGSVIHIESNCVSFPITSDENLLAPMGWYPLFPEKGASGRARRTRSNCSWLRP